MAQGSKKRSLTAEDKMEVFKIATRGLVHHFGDQFEAGMTDKELRAALEVALGIFGGSGGPDCLSVSYKGSNDDESTISNTFLPRSLQPFPPPCQGSEKT
jgi:hypothetical protein